MLERSRINRRIQVLGYTKYKEMIRLSGKAYPVEDDMQEQWIDTIFAEQPYLAHQRRAAILYRTKPLPALRKLYGALSGTGGHIKKRVRTCYLCGLKKKTQ